MRRTYKDITYALSRSTRKTVAVAVERDGQVAVRAPEALSDRQIEAVIERKRGWIYRHLAQWHDLNAAWVVREYVNGERFLYLGRLYRLKLVEDQAVPLLLKDGYFCLRSDYGDAPHADAAFRAFYHQKDVQRIGERLWAYQTSWACSASVSVCALTRPSWACSRTPCACSN
jgi:predicted metal-dependent hydrolase